MAVGIVAREKGDAQYFAAVRKTFSVHHEFYNSIIHDEDVTQAQVWTRLAKEVGGHFKIAEETFIAQLNNSVGINHPLRWQFKYAISQGIAGTPSFKVNGVLVERDVTNLSIEQWREILNHSE